MHDGDTIVNVIYCLGRSDPTLKYIRIHWAPINTVLVTKKEISKLKNFKILMNSKEFLTPVKVIMIKKKNKFILEK